MIGTREQAGKGMIPVNLRGSPLLNLEYAAPLVRWIDPETADRQLIRASASSRGMKSWGPAGMRESPFPRYGQAKTECVSAACGVTVPN
jgi:hypothetical protein